MKMEASITTPVAGTVTRVALAGTAQLDGGDLVLVIALPQRDAARPVGQSCPPASTTCVMPVT
jgi:hypothetical protein